ncbi:hypothetical protein ISN44_As01g011510 [Arabidopsis suecica]|uniref:Secreted protein n=1 Tax=Arabidopsis suecica TaxID=45249 RepID=A0A8T2H522_ARASU|nr:hypothetical protein ISN44_As01g011510 [Arabidopsis suecica]
MLCLGTDCWLELCCSLLSVLLCNARTSTYFSSPEICLPADDSLVSTITSVEARIDTSSTDRIQSIVDLPASVQSLRSEINERVWSSSAQERKFLTLDHFQHDSAR